MLPPEFHELLSKIRDHEQQNPAPQTVKEHAKTVFFVLLLVLFILVFVLGILIQEVMPWFSWLGKIWE
jgi:cytochrome b561